eukprot:Tamp_21954.p1 GENE.Tamp_21954~~Tamp_21954.p1  ORF type:complete len:240 (+),score=40.10 Tamp_21954:2-721(+)
MARAMAFGWVFALALVGATKAFAPSAALPCVRARRALHSAPSQERQLARPRAWRMQENPRNPAPTGEEGAPWDQHERARFMSTLKKAQASNKAREVFVGVFMSRLAHRDRAAKARFLNWYIDAIFPPRRQRALVSVIKSVPSQMLASKHSGGSATTVGACMRNNLDTYRNLTPQAKEEVYENMTFLSNLAMLNVGLVILLLLLQDVATLFHQFQMIYPDLKFQKELIDYAQSLDITMHK